MAQFNFPVSDFMSSPVHVIDPGADLVDAHRALKQHRISCLGVEEDGKLCGVVSRTDLLRVGRTKATSRPQAELLTFPRKPVREAMTADVITVAPGDSLGRAAALMQENRVHRVFVCEDGKAQGVISTRDLMSAIRDAKVSTPAAEYASSPAFTIRFSEPISVASERLEKARVHGLVVVEESGWPVGLFTQQEALRARSLPRETEVESVMDPAILCLESETPLHRAAGQAAALGVRRIVTMQQGKMHGILTGIDLTRAMD